MEIYKLLNGSNCRECKEKTCLTFAVAVFKGKKPIHACPCLDPEVIERYGGTIEKTNTIDKYKAEAIELLKTKVSLIDLSEAAKRLGAPVCRQQTDPENFWQGFFCRYPGQHII